MRSAMGTPTPCSAPRSSTTGSTQSPRRSAGCGRPASRFAPSTAQGLLSGLLLVAGRVLGKRLLNNTVLRRAGRRCERVERLVSGQEDLLAVRDHRVVGAVRVLEDLLPVADVEPEGGGGLQV